MKSFITGADGFVAPYLGKELRLKGHFVIGSFNKSISVEKKLSYGETVQLDITNKKDVQKIFSKYKPDNVFHLAGISSPWLSIQQPEITMKINQVGTGNIINAMSKLQAKPKLLFISSAAVYGNPKKLPISEEHPTAPNTPYALSKLKAEKLALDYARHGNFAVVLRSFNHIGSGQGSDFVCSAFGKQIAEIEKGIKKPTIKVGNLDATRDFMDVRDTVNAYAIALEKCKSGGIYNICSGREYKIKDILDIMLKMSKAKIKVKQDPAKMKNIDILRLKGDNSKFLKETGWQPKIKIEESLKNILEYWRQNT